MYKHQLLLILSVVFGIFSSCTQDENLSKETEVALKKLYEQRNVNVFSSKEAFALALEGKATPVRSATAQVRNISEATDEEVFMVPNEKILSYLSDKMEIVVGDTLYRVTPNGTYYAHVNDAKEFDQYVNSTDGFNLVQKGLKRKGKVFLVDTHNTWDGQDNPITNPNFFDDPDDALYENAPDPDLMPSTRMHNNHREITDEDFASFPQIGIAKPNFLQKALTFFFNKTHYSKYRFKSNGRRKLYVSFYNKDFAFYNTGGFDVKVMKKLWHGGWGRMVTWNEGIYSGFSMIKIEHELHNYWAKELNHFIHTNHKHLIQHNNNLLNPSYVRASSQDYEAHYDEYPFQNESGHQGKALVVLTSFPKDLNRENLSRTLATETSKMTRGLGDQAYSQQAPSHQLLFLNTEAPNKAYTIYRNIVKFNGGGYRVRDEFFHERKEFNFNINIQGGNPTFGKFSLPKTGGIVNSKIVAVDGYVYTLDGDNFIGVKIIDNTENN